MGYDPYDYYDLGEFDQKGGVPTWFSSRAELLDLIESAHGVGLQVSADLVFNHNSGGDRIANREHAAIQQRQVNSNRAIQGVENHCYQFDGNR